MERFKKMKFKKIINLLIIAAFFSCCSADGSSVLIFPSTPKGPSKNKVQDEQWYSISYESAYGNVPESKIVEAGYRLQSSDLPFLSFDGWNFMGWDKSEGYTVVSDVLIKAKWEQAVSQQTPSNTKVTIWEGSKSFNDTSWGINLTLSAGTFSSFTGGSKIIFEWTPVSGASYNKIKLNRQGNTWTEITGGTVTGGEKESGSNSDGYKLLSSPITYTVTSANASALKADGLAVNGYGFVLTKIYAVIQPDSSYKDPEGPETPSALTPEEIQEKEKPVIVSGTPYSNHGKLHVNGAFLYDEHNKKYQLYGMSTHGLNFGENMSCYVNQSAFNELLTIWNTNCIRLVLYPRDYQGYCNGGNQADLKNIIKKGIEYATNAGMYVIVDWHVHAYNPNETKDAGKTFLTEFAKEYKNYGNILYEICNEPKDSPWDTEIKPYAEEIIPCIRKFDSDAVIIVGTNSWSQDIGEAYNNPLDISKYGNLMYSFHFYAGSHAKLYDGVESYAKKGLPIFISEFGTCDASGNGGFNKSESEKWFKLCKDYSISHMNWSLCNKSETASAIQSWCNKTSGWDFNDLTDSGKTVVNHFKTLER